jgi:hypothetical protein
MRQVTISPKLPTPHKALPSAETDMLAINPAEFEIVAKGRNEPVNDW